MVAKAPPDGYTLLMTASTMAVSPTAYPKLPYDVIRDFAPITLVAQTPYVLAVNLAVNAQTLPELLALARNAPGKLNYGSPGNGTLSHLAFELLRSKTGIDVAVVPYKGSSPAIVAVLSGQVDAVLDSAPGVMVHTRAKKLRALAVTSNQRAQNLPDIPTFAESGVRDYDVRVWFGLLAPAGTPRSVIARIHADTLKVLASPALMERLKAESLDIVTMQPDEFGAYLRSEIAKWRDVIRQANIRFE
jgi:tripartite-type tricarboxylate transporter receptor subunit TctC